MKRKPVIISSETKLPVISAFGGGLEGAERTSRETARWNPSMRSPDQVINYAKPMADARSRDMVQNDGYAAGAEALHKDNVVGSQFRLNAQPNWRLLGADEGWAEEFQVVVENRFHTIAESEDCWFDASRRNTFTGMIRLAVGGFLFTGEVLATAEWLRNPRRPCRTAIQTISPDRLSNPNGNADDREWRRGVKRDAQGAPVAYAIRNAHPSELYDHQSLQWKIVNAEKPWGRKQVIHIIEQRMPDQTRGISDMVAVLKQMRMTKNFQEITLQNAVINASYAAAIESELPSSDVFAAIGAGASTPIAGMGNYFDFYMQALTSYLGESKTIALDGAKIPHLFPGTKLNLKPIGTPGGVGTEFEESLLRYTAASLGLSYEEFARDYSKVNYSSARASMNNTYKFMQSRKKSVADRLANNIYALYLEEDIAAGNIPLPKGKTRDWFYEPLVKDALTTCTWIGAGRGQIDELKETEAALARIAGGLSTYEKECARLGDDFRTTFEQRAREEAILKRYGLQFAAMSGEPTNNQQDNDTSDAAANRREEEAA